MIMKRTIILLKAIFIFLIISQGCNIIMDKTGEKGKKNFIFSSDLNGKYYFKKSCCLFRSPHYSNLNDIQTYRNSMIVGKILNKKYDDFINKDIYRVCQCVLFNDNLYIKIGDDNKSIFLNAKTEEYEIVVIMPNEHGSSLVFTPQESTLKMSLNEFHVGDTVIGEIYLSYRDSLFGYECDGHFMGIIDPGTEEWEKINLYNPSGESIFQEK